MHRYLSGQPIALSLSATDEDGTAVLVVAPAAAVITDGSGAQVDAGAATVTAGVLSYLVAADKVAKLDTYQVTWTGSVGGVASTWRESFEVVGGHLFEVADIRTRVREAADATRYPAALIRAYRVAAEQRFERSCRCAFVPRGRRAKLTGEDAAPVLLPDPLAREIYSISVDGVLMTAEDLAQVRLDKAVSAIVYGWRRGSVLDVHYTHGEDSPPEPVRAAVITLAADGMLPNSTPSRATAVTTELGTYRVTVAGRDGATGIPEVDAVIADFGWAAPAVG